MAYKYRFSPSSWDEINPEHRSAHSSWETPDPGYWTKHGYAVVRADEKGLGQSPGVLDTMVSGAFPRGEFYHMQ